MAKACIRALNVMETANFTRESIERNDTFSSIIALIWIVRIRPCVCFIITAPAHLRFPVRRQIKYHISPRDRATTLENNY